VLFDRLIRTIELRRNQIASRAKEVVSFKCSTAYLIYRKIAMSNPFLTLNYETAIESLGGDYFDEVSHLSASGKFTEVDFSQSEVEKLTPNLMELVNFIVSSKID
jgi:hypothetical protein